MMLKKENTIGEQFWGFCSKPPSFCKDRNNVIFLRKLSKLASLNFDIS